LRQLFTELDFFSLVEELGSASAGAQGEAVAPARELETVDEARAALSALAPAGAGHEVFLALLNEDAPLGLALGGAEGEILYLDFRRPGLRAAALEALAQWLADPQRALAGHNLKEVLRLVPSAWECCAGLFDLMLASYLLTPSIHGHTLEEMALERLGTKALTLKEVGWDKGQE